VRYASSTGWGKMARSSARGQRHVAVLLTGYAASAFINGDQVRSSPLGAHCLGGRTLYRPFTMKVVTWSTPDQESSMSTLWRQEEFKQICSRESLTEKAADID